MDRKFLSAFRGRQLLLTIAVGPNFGQRIIFIRGNLRRDIPPTYLLLVRNTR